MSSQLIEKLRTIDDLELLRSELDLLRDAIYQSAIKYEDVLKSGIRSWVSEIIVSESKTEGMAKYIERTYNELDNVSVIYTSVYFEPSSTFIERISDWLKKNVEKNVIVDVLLNTSLLGGIQLSYKGKYLDLSLKKRLSQELGNISLNKAPNIKNHQ